MEGDLDTQVDPQMIHILVVDDDPTCLAVIAATLRSCNYDVLAVNDANEALETLRMMEGQIDMVVTDVHMPYMNGFELQKHVKEEFNLPVIMVTADEDENTRREGLEGGAAYFMVKPLCPDDLKNIRRCAVETKKEEPALLAKKKPHLKESASSSRVKEDEEKIEKRREYKRKTPKKDDEVENVGGSKTKRKPKMVWSTWLHNLFLLTINTLGFEKCVPKRILEFMDVPGLTRENIASHLQKYRLFLRRTDMQDAGTLSLREKIKLRSSFASKEYSYLCDNNYQLKYIQFFQEKQMKRANRLKPELDNSLELNNGGGAYSTNSFQGTSAKYGTSQLSLNDIQSPPNTSFGSNRLYNTRHTGEFSSSFMANVGINGMTSFQNQARGNQEELQGKPYILGLQDLDLLSQDGSKHGNNKYGQTQVNSNVNAGGYDDRMGGCNYLHGTSKNLGGRHFSNLLLSPPSQPVVDNYATFNNSPLPRSFVTGDPRYASNVGQQKSVFTQPTPIREHLQVRDETTDLSLLEYYLNFGMNSPLKSLVGGDQHHIPNIGQQESVFVQPPPPPKLLQEIHVKDEALNSSTLFVSPENYPTFNTNSPSQLLANGGRQENYFVEQPALPPSQPLQESRESSYPAFNKSLFMPSLESSFEDPFWQQILEEAPYPQGGEQEFVGKASETVQLPVQPGGNEKAMNPENISENIYGADDVLAWLDSQPNKDGVEEMADMLFKIDDCYNLTDQSWP